MKKKFHFNVNLPMEVKEGIESRSSMLSASFHFLEKVDLMQDGYLLVYEILNRYPDAPLNYIMKAINNKYSSIQSDAIAQKKATIPLEEDISIEMDRQEGKDHKSNKTKSSNFRVKRDALLANGNGDLAAIYLLREAGYTFKEIATMMGIDTKTIRRKIENHAKI